LGGIAKMFNSWQYNFNTGIPQFERYIFVTIAKYWVPDLPDIKSSALIMLERSLDGTYIHKTTGGL